MNTALKRPRRLSVSVVVLGAPAAGFLLLSIGQLAHHPPATQSDIWTSAELVEGYAHCDSVLRLVFEGSHNVTSKETRGARRVVESELPWRKSSRTPPSDSFRRRWSPPRHDGSCRSGEAPETSAVSQRRLSSVWGAGMARPRTDTVHVSGRLHARSSRDGTSVLSSEDLASIDRRLAETNRLLAARYPGDRGARQPVHTVYVPADTFTPDLPERWGAEALSAVESFGGAEALALALGIDGALAPRVAARVLDKLATEPIEDLRLDFEDGYGIHTEEEEDTHAAGASSAVTEAIASGQAPPFIGLRFKSLHEPTRRRGLRTLDMFLGGLLAGGDLPDRLVLTLPKVSTVSQVEAMVFACERLEAAYGISHGRLRFEVQVETPQLILGADGTAPVATMLHFRPAASRVCTTAPMTTARTSGSRRASSRWSTRWPTTPNRSCRSRSPGTGVRLSDGSSNVLPVGDPRRYSRPGSCTHVSCDARGARLLPGLGSARGPVAEPVHCHVRVLSRRARCGMHPASGPPEPSRQRLHG